MPFAVSSPKSVVLLALSSTVFTSAVLLTACGSSHESFVQVRAADDFECTAEGIDVEEVARSRYMARGCGKEGEYVCSATPDGVDCSQSSDLDVESGRTDPEASASAAPSSPTP
jgi:hypothetical protein